MKNLSLIFILFTFCSGIQSIAQTLVIKGKVTDKNTGEPLAGVNVIIWSTTKGTVTDPDGLYSISAPSNGKIEFAYLSYASQIVNIEGRSTIDIQMVSTNSELDQVVVVGSRRPGRILMESTTPIDVVNVKQSINTTARMDLTSMLNYAAPSINYNKQSGSDGADHIDLATLRGLGPDQSLVLVNGKRRHQTAFVSVFGTRGRGNSGTDLNAFPAAALDRVEILRDGDLNQYVYENKLDGNTISADLNYGIKLGKQGGFANFTLNYLSLDKTYRQSLDQNFDAEYGLPVNVVRRAHGDGSLNSAGAFVNAELTVTDELKLYAFGGFNNKSSEAYAFSRNFSGKPNRFITNTSGQLVDIPGIIKKSGDTNTATADSYFNPIIATDVQDFSAAVGIRRENPDGWNWDLSNVTGQNNFHFYGEKTVNASLGDVNKNHFDDGGFKFLQNTTNLNFNREFSGFLEGIGFAAGAELRLEQYELYAGEEASYKNYDPNKTVITGGGDTVFVAGGSQGFPGYQPSDEVNAQRVAAAAYADAELDVTKDFLVSAAVRLENYNDFGFTHNYKLASRYLINNKLNIRGSLSTGFRAPSLQQINFSSTFTTVQGGNISEVKIAPNDNSITKAAGIPELKQEESVNASLGFAWKAMPQLSISCDLYWVNIKDRVVLSGQFDASDNTLDPAFTAELNRLRVGLAQFFANAVNTTNKGIDLVFDYNRKFGVNRIRLLAMGNIQEMTIDKINVPEKLNDTESHRKQFLSDREQAFILASAPPVKLGFNLEYGYKKLGIGTRLTYFGKIKILGYGEDGLGIAPQVPNDDNTGYLPDEYIYNSKWVTDIYASCQITKNLNINVGVDNLLNIHPDLGAVKGAKWWAFNNETGGPWDAVQMGGNGMRMFARLGFVF
ncbi:MAG: TonB-dependent receptor [Saprospiraceae bacterium]|nr:TonB-dependent receptor [Candidatus Vicinibacter affinis]